MTSFETTLKSSVGPRLSGLGYEYDTRLRAGDELFGFRKALGDEVFAIVQFQRHPHAAGDTFTINLIRVKAERLEARVYDGYAGSLGARLSHVLWFVANVRTYDQPDRWWTLAELDGVLDTLERDGLPWLEDPAATKPWEMPIHHGQEFVAEVTSIIAPDLQAQGYRLTTQSLVGDFPYPYFVKPLPEGGFALIEFQSVYSVDPAQFTFDVRLQRKANDNPLDFGGHYREWRAASLGQLVWREHYAESDALTVTAVQSVLWHYADQAELADRLRSVQDQLHRIALPWLEGSASIEAATIK